jgi:hypothetical protein
MLGTVPGKMPVAQHRYSYVMITCKLSFSRLVNAVYSCLLEGPLNTYGADTALYDSSEADHCTVAEP